MSTGEKIGLVVLGILVLVIGWARFASASPSNGQANGGGAAGNGKTPVPYPPVTVNQSRTFGTEAVFGGQPYGTSGTTPWSP
jgi:hypothetical protein